MQEPTERIHFNDGVLLVGDVRQTLNTVETGSVSCCITSPPYWGLRDYGHAGQIGLEDTPEQYIDALRAVFAEVYRVLRDDGTLWLNLGDTYVGHNSRASNNGRAGFGNPRETVAKREAFGLPKKNLIGMPWRVAFALQQDGWILRQDIIWHKPNPLPESVLDRCTKSHEYIFMFSKKPKYLFNAHAIKEQAITTGYEERNKRSVWHVNVKPFKGAHFAVMPEALVEPCILAGSNAGDIVLDPFMGSGTVGVVSQRLGRHWTGCENNSEYVNLIKGRMGING